MSELSNLIGWYYINVYSYSGHMIVYKHMVWVGYDLGFEIYFNSVLVLEERRCEEEIKMCIYI